MASLRTSSAARLLRNASQTRSVLPAARRFESNVPILNKEQDLNTSVKRTDPNYEAQFDRATSTFTPVPKHILDGSEDTDIVPAALVSGAPLELQARQVRIFQPSKSATQSGTWGQRKWRMDWDVLGKGHRWENGLMGWQSSGDMMQGTAMNFKSKEDAIRFAEKQGYDYFVQEPNSRHFTPKAYANNFLYSPGKLKHVRTK
ncbi:NADH:ubiquinone oxidoreductase 21kD subunit [Coniochaeta pulveracea]|uniref:NADH dehydrogenase [ubiquinone] iron-sulfur protein 4, mitochondrial n=1 Tax=Coniochaeta pulveracea TaxID=177199 RepID=A0A420YG54_9PEZI|nr:NADH:ubiquinone oxidoreductase 21kD subunit [Coniochaeta pulveracea]